MPRIIFHDGQMHIIPDDAPQGQTDGILEMKYNTRRGLWHLETENFVEDDTETPSIIENETVKVLDYKEDTYESFNTNSGLDTENT